MAKAGIDVEIRVTMSAWEIFKLWFVPKELRAGLVRLARKRHRDRWPL